MLTTVSSLSLRANLTVGIDTTNTKANFAGSVILTQIDEASPYTSVMVNITGLNPGTNYGMHVHQSCSVTSCADFGGHWDTTPSAPRHGKWVNAQDTKHIGDLPMCQTDQSGSCYHHVTFLYKMLLGASDFANVTKANGVVLHSTFDDFGLLTTGTSTTTGNAGSRLACGCLAVYSYAQLVAAVPLLLALFY